MRIVIVKTDNIGDAVLFSGAIKSIRNRWPTARIELVVKKSVVSFYARCPYLDRVHSVLRFAPWLRARKYFYKGTWLLERILKLPLFVRLWCYKYDLLICAVSAPLAETLALCYMIPATKKLGFGGFNYNAKYFKNSDITSDLVFDEYVHCLVEDCYRHDTWHTRQLMYLLGIPDADLSPECWTSSEDQCLVDSILPKNTRNVGVCIFTESSEGMKNWSLLKWADLLRKLDFDNIILLGGEKDVVESKKMMSLLPEKTRQRVLCVAGHTTLSELCLFVKRCDAIISLDTSLLHVAVAQNVPSVGIIGDYDNGRFYPWGNSCMHVRARPLMNCAGCNKDCVHPYVKCVQDIEVRDVLKGVHIAMQYGRKQICQMRECVY